MDKNTFLTLFKQHEQSVLLSNEIIVSDSSDFSKALGDLQWPALWVVHPSTKSFYKVTARNLVGWLRRFDGGQGKHNLPYILTHLSQKNPFWIFVVSHDNWKNHVEHTLDKFLSRVATPRYSIFPRHTASLLWGFYEIHSKKTGMSWYCSGPKDSEPKYFTTKIKIAVRRMLRVPPTWCKPAHKAVLERVSSGDLCFEPEDIQIMFLRDLNKKQVDTNTVLEQTRKNISQICRMAGDVDYMQHVDLSAGRVSKIGKKVKPAFLLN